MPALMLDTLTLPDFTSRIGASFRVAGTDSVSLSLRQANSLARKTAPPVPGRREPFDLIFVGPKSPILAQSIYRLEQDGVEPLEIFIVPIGPFEGGIGYQAIFT
jgi:hypothetical protein